MKTIRESFEDWYSDGGVYPNAIKLRTAGGEYLLAQAATSWNVWQAAHSSRDEEVQRLQEQVKLLREALESVASVALEGDKGRKAKREYEARDGGYAEEILCGEVRKARAALEATKEGA